jgi:signal transduction histidine kinase
MRRVQDSIRHLNGLVSQVRSQIKGEIATARFNIADEIDQVVKMLEYKARGHDVTIIWQSEPRRQELFYSGSVNHFWQIITNLISNAIDAYEGKHDARRVLLHVARDASGIRIHVTDFGVGIPKVKQEKIFEPFYSTKKAGTGIGLAIVKRMVEKDFGGTINITSKPGQGTTFTITLPSDKTA